MRSRSFRPSRPSSHGAANLVLAAAFLAGCAGGASDGRSPAIGPPPAQIGGIQGTGITTQGAVTGFGSIFVNGIEFRTNAASFVIDGRPGTESELRVGHVVVVRGTVDDGGRGGNATRVEFDDDVRGPVQARFDRTTGTLVVLGQTVAVDGATSFGGAADAAALAAGEAVAVSGFRDAAGTIRATRIDRIGSATAVEITGPIAALDVAARSFRIGTQVVDWSAATRLQDFTNPANGQFVEVEGPVVGGVLRATSVEGRSRGFALGNGDRASVEGVVTRFASAADFDVNGTRARLGAGVAPPAGLVLALGARVELDGSADANGVLVATRIRARDGGDSRATGPVTAIDAAAGRFAVFGVAATVGVGTRFEDQSALRQQPFDLTRLRVGDYVEARGVGVPGGLAAGYVERRDVQPRIELRGVATDVDAAAQRLRVLGVGVRLAPAAECRDLAEQAIPCSAWFGRLTATSRVTARDSRGTASVPGSELVADRLELEN